MIKIKLKPSLECMHPALRGPIWGFKHTMCHIIWPVLLYMSHAKYPNLPLKFGKNILYDKNMVKVPENQYWCD